MIVLISYENSGRTWLSCMLKEIEIPVNVCHFGGCLSSFENIDKFLKKYPNKFQEDNIIFLHREPKDIIVSNYFQMKYRVGTYKKSIQEFIKDPNYGIEKIIKYNLLINDISNYISKIKISYEFLRNDTNKGLNKIISHLNFSIPDYVLQNVIYKFSFDEMKQREKNKYGNYYWFSKTDINNDESFKTRKGIIGGYINYLTEEDILWCNYLIEKFNYYEKMNI